jgi:hypothetical protein
MPDGIFTKAMDVDAFLREIKQTTFADNLSDYVKRAFTMAHQHRCATGVENEMLRSVRAYKCMYDPEDLELLENPNEVYMGVTNLKCRALQSWLLDIIAQAEDKPWTLEPTPVPQLPTRLEDIVVNRLALEFERGGFDEDLRDVASDAKSIALEYAQDMAKEAVEGMEALIADQMAEGGWREAFSDFVVDLSVFPSAIVKGPTMGYEEGLHWRDGRPVTDKEVRLHTGRVSPFDVFPAPNATTTQNGTFICHVEHVNQSDLFEMIGIHGFDEVAIRQIIAAYPNGATNWLPMYQSMTDCIQKTDHDANAPDHEYNVLVYYGKVPGALLHEHGIADADIHSMVECEIRVCAGRVIRAITNPYPLGRRPLHSAEVQSEPGAFWGRSLPSLLRDVQRVANASARALVKNVGFSAGPITEYDADRLADEDSIDELTPYRMFAVKPDPFSANTPALRFSKIDNVSTRLLEVYEKFRREADDVSGIPAYALGNPQTSGAGRTLGGLSLLMGNAAKGVKRILSNVDKGVVEPLIEMHYHLNLIYSDDETVKADAGVVTRGASGLLQRELSQARAVEVLQLLTPYAANGLVPPEAVIIVLRDVVKSLGYNADELVADPQAAQRLALAAAQVQATGQLPAPLPDGIPPNIQPTAEGTPLPELDGRSSVPADPASLEALIPSN